MVVRNWSPARKTGRRAGTELIVATAKNPWDRLDSDSPKDWGEPESPQAFAAFVKYRDLGPSRSIEKGGNRGAKGGRTARREKWSSDHRWIKRTAAYDVYLDKIKVKAVETSEKEQVALWIKRRDDLFNREYIMGMNLFARAASILGGRDIETTEGGVTTILHVNASAADCVRAARVSMRASDLSRRGVEGATKRTLVPEKPLTPWRPTAYDEARPAPKFIIVPGGKNMTVDSDGTVQANDPDAGDKQPL